MPWKNSLLIVSIALERVLFLDTSWIFSADIVILGLYTLLISISWIFARINPWFLRIKSPRPSQYLIASWIIFRGNSSFLDKSFILISLLYFDIKNKYKYTFKKSPFAWDKYSVKNTSGIDVWEINKEESFCSIFIVIYLPI